MWFLNPLFWLGIGAVAAPILVHLVRRTRARKIEFPALTFVRQVPQRTIRRRTFRNLLLLLLRCLAILLVVIAFTRPFFTRRSERRRRRRRHSYPDRFISQHAAGTDLCYCSAKGGIYY
jgi:aerotolerance regulator-like protein